MGAPPGKLIEADAYYAFSSVFFYTNRSALLWNGRVDNLEYGSYAPGAPQVFIDDAKFEKLWSDMTALPEVDCRFVVVPRRPGQQLKDQAQLDGWLRDGSARHVELLCAWE